MRATLEQLKALDPIELRQRWSQSEFPFDAAAGCRQCLTSHAVANSCSESAHADFRARATELWRKMNDGSGSTGGILLKHIEEFYALRLFYDSLYPPKMAVEESEAREIQTRQASAKGESQNTAVLQISQGRRAAASA